MSVVVVIRPGLWSRGVAENFNDPDSGQTFCSPVVTVCATNVHRRHTWQFKQLDTSTRDDHGYSDRWQRTNMHTFTQGIPDQQRPLGSSRNLHFENAIVRGLYH